MWRLRLLRPVTTASRFNVCVEEGAWLIEVLGEGHVAVSDANQSSRFCRSGNQGIRLVGPSTAGHTSAGHGCHGDRSRQTAQNEKNINVCGARAATGATARILLLQLVMKTYPTKSRFNFNKLSIHAFALAFAACSQPSDAGREYSEADQSAALAKLEGVYATIDGSVSLTICESDEIEANTCQASYFIRRGTDDVNTTPAETGCGVAGGCFYEEVSTGVRMEISEGDRTDVVRGEALFGYESEADPLALPFEADVHNDNGLNVSVTINGDGSADISMTRPSDASSAAPRELSLVRMGDADCVANPITQP